MLQTQKGRSPSGKDKPARRSRKGGGTASGAQRAASDLEPQHPGGTPGISCAYVGCYTTAQRYSRGDGIHVYRVDNAWW